MRLGTLNTDHYAFSTKSEKGQNCEVTATEKQMNVSCEQLTNNKGPRGAWSIRQDVGQDLHM